MRQMYAYVCTGSDCRLKQIILFSSLPLSLDKPWTGRKKEMHFGWDVVCINGKSWKGPWSVIYSCTASPYVWMIHHLKPTTQKLICSPIGGTERCVSSRASVVGTNSLPEARSHPPPHSHRSGEDWRGDISASRHPHHSGDSVAVGSTAAATLQFIILKGEASGPQTILIGCPITRIMFMLALIMTLQGILEMSKNSTGPLLRRVLHIKCWAP